MKDFVNRPPADAKKIHSRNEFELCYIRHQYFRRVNYNPKLEDMKPYSRIIEYLSRNTFYTYRYLFATVGMELDDVTNIGRIHMVNFIGLFEIGPEKNVDKYKEFCNIFKAKNNASPGIDDLVGKNKANLTMFMKQRMEDLVRICKQKAKNIKGLQVDEYIPFYGTQPPPEDIYKLLKNNESYGYKRLDNVAFKAIKKRSKANIKEPFQFAGIWYVAVPLEQRSLTALDLSGAGLDPYESEHNKNPEQLLFRKEEEIRFDKNRKMFKNYSKEEKASVLMGWIEKNENNPVFKEEINIAKKYLRNMGHIE